MPIIQLLTQYRYFVLLPAVIIEGPMITFLSGYLISTGTLQWRPVLLTVVLGDVISDLLHYALGYYGGMSAIKKRGPRLHIGVERVELFRQKLHYHKISTICSKVLYGIGGIPIIACGIAQVPMLQFLCISIPVSFLQMGFYLLCGYFFGQFYSQIVSYLNIGSRFLYLLFAVIVAAYFYFKKKV